MGGKAGQLEGMSRRWVFLWVFIAGAVAAGVGVGYALVSETSNDRYAASDSVQDGIGQGDIDTSVVPVDVGRSGPGCLEGLCVDSIPESIAYQDVAAYLVVLRDALRADGTAVGANTCHGLAHEIGRRAAGGAPVEDLLDLDDGRCLYGYQHGVLEGWSITVDTENLLEAIPTVCSVYAGTGTRGGLGKDELSYASGSCAHGVGHAIAIQGPTNVEEALTYCDGLGEADKGGCAGGIFMAYADGNASQGDYAPRRPLDLTGDEVRTLCPRLEGAYAIECWSKLWLLGTRVGMGAMDVAALCPTDGEGAEWCGRGVGEGLLYETELEVDVALDRCPSTLSVWCIAGVAWSNANSHVRAGGQASDYISVCLGDIDSSVCRESEKSALRGAVQ